MLKAEKILIVIFYFLLHNFCNAELACPRILVPDGYLIRGQTTTSKGSITLSDCCFKCNIEERSQALIWYSNKINDPKALGSCFCRKGLIKVEETTTWICTISYFYQTKFHPLSMEEGNQTKINVYDTTKPVNNNDTIEFFTFEDSKNITKMSKAVNIIGIDNNKLVLTYKSDKMSKRMISIVHDVTRLKKDDLIETQTEWGEPFNINLQIFGLNYRQRTDKIWLATMRSNDKYYSFHAEPAALSTPTEYLCDIDNMTISNSFKDGKLRANISIESNNCNTDFDSNIKFIITAEAGFRVETIQQNKDCIAITKHWLVGSTAYVQYQSFYAMQNICFYLVLGVENDTNIFHGTQTLNAVVEAYLPGKEFTKIITTVLSNEKDDKKVTEKSSTSDVISILLHNNTYMFCIQTSNRDNSQCMRYKVGKAISILDIKFVSILAYDTASKTIYGKDKNGQVILITKEEEEEAKSQIVSPKHWKRIKIMYSENLIYPNIIYRKDLINSSFQLGEAANVTYDGIYEFTSKQYLLLWPTDTH